jgi:hypothetical protein
MMKMKIKRRAFADTHLSLDYAFQRAIPADHRRLLHAAERPVRTATIDGFDRTTEITIRKQFVRA